jgi:hypothetical protein
MPNKCGRSRLPIVGGKDKTTGKVTIHAEQTASHDAVARARPLLSVSVPSRGAEA